MVDPVVQAPAAHAERPDPLAAVDLFAFVGQPPRLVHRQVRVDQHLRVNAEITDIRLGDQRADRIGHTADAELNHGAVDDLVHDVGGGPPVHFIERAGRQFEQLAVGTLDDVIDIRDMDAFFPAAQRDRQVVVGFDDHDLRGVQNGPGRRIRRRKIEETMLVHRSQLEHGHVDLQPAAVVRRLVAVHHRNIVDEAGFVPFALQPAEMPATERESVPIRVDLDHFAGLHRERSADLHVLQLIFPPGQCGVQQRRLRQRHPIVDPLPGLNDGHCLLRRAQLGLIFALQTQFDFLPST